MASLTGWASFWEGSLHYADLISVSGTRKPRSSRADNVPSLNQRPRKGGLTGSPVIFLTGFLRITSEFDDAARLSFRHHAIDLWKGLSSEPLGCFMENSAGYPTAARTTTHPRNPTVQREGWPAWGESCGAVFPGCRYPKDGVHHWTRLHLISMDGSTRCRVIIPLVDRTKKLAFFIRRLTRPPSTRSKLCVP